MAPEHLRLVGTSALDEPPAVRPERHLRVLLIENHPRIREGMLAILGGSGIDVVEERINPPLILSHVIRWRPDVILVAVQLDGEGGFELLDRLHHETPEPRILVLTMQRSAAFAQRALRRGATAVVLKDRADSELLPAVWAAADGECYVSPLIAAL